MTDRTGGSEALRAVLREFVDRFDGIDDGHCRVCGRYRLHDTRGNRQPCSDPGCLSNRAAEALASRPLTDTSGRLDLSDAYAECMAARVDTPDSEPSADAPAECIWTEDFDGGWQTGCGEMFVLNDGSPSENGMRYCYGCGKPLREVPDTGEAYDDA